MRRPRKAIRIGVPILVIGLLSLAALWRVGTPPKTTLAVTPAPRPATLERVRVRSTPSPRTAWVDAGSRVAPGQPEDIFVVLDPDVKRATDAPWQPGTRVTVIGLVRPSPDPATAIRQWGIDQPTADELQKRGTYLHVTEIR
jgi:hypothetical protein